MLGDDPGPSQWIISWRISELQSCKIDMWRSLRLIVILIIWPTCHYLRLKQRPDDTCMSPQIICNQTPGKTISKIFIRQFDHYNRSIEKYPSSTSSMGSSKAELVEWPKHVTRHLIHLLTQPDRLTDHPAVDDICT